MNRSLRSTLMLSFLALPIAAIVAVFAPSHAAADGGTAAVQGQVRLQGTAPKPAPIDMSADPFCAKANPSAKTNEVVTDEHGGLANVVVYISDGLAGQTFDPPKQPIVFEQKGCMYEPHVLAMRAGQKLDVVNDDKTTHNIHPMPNNNREWNKSQPPGIPIEETFMREEVAIPVKCNVHPWMKSYIVVLKHPYFAVSDKTGGFTIADLPAGNYKLTAWHEKLGTSVQAITITGGATQTVQFTFKSPGM